MLAKLMRFSFLAVICTVLTAVLTSVSTAVAAPSKPYVIYGDDDRAEVFEDNDPARHVLAESVLAVFLTSDLSHSGPGEITILGDTYGDSYKLCRGEKFFEQTDTANCTAFLVDKNIIATAGHCVRETGFCKKSSFAFGYMKDQKGRNPNKIKASDVYGCKRVLHDEMNKFGGDYALVELDRPVVGRSPLEFARQLPGIGESVFTIGHPSGLPAKISTGGTVREQQAEFFVVNLDTFGGNSGSPVFNENYEVTGVLVRGEEDFVPGPNTGPRNNCYISHRCPSGLCRGEDVSSASPIAETLQKLQSSALSFKSQTVW